MFEIIFGVPQGSTLVPLLISIFLADLCFVLKSLDIINFGNTPYTSPKNTDELIESRKKSSNTLFQ